jgi:NDP-sugar pyrophosphorylase family protein
MTPHSEPFHALILAGGQGSRLYPLTASIPKPLLPIGERRVIELIIRRLALFGVGRIIVAVGHLADMIEKFLGDGKRLGVPIDYVREAYPLGTAGAIGLIPPWEEPLVVMNGDILCNIDFSRLLAWHRDHGAALTVATKLRSLSMEVGVLATDASLRVTAVVEKPSIEQRINLGTYVLSASVRAHVATNQRLEMPELMRELIACGKPVVAYDHPGFWLDIGRPEDLARAQADPAMWLKTTEERDPETRATESHAL